MTLSGSGALAYLRGVLMGRGRHGCQVSCVLLKLDDDDPGGLSVMFSDAVTGTPHGYMHPEDFKRIWDEVEAG